MAVLMGTSIAGGVVCGLVAALASDGIPEDAAKMYHDRVASGQALVTVLTSADHAAGIEKTLEDGGGRQIGFFKRILDSVQSIES